MLPADGPTRVWLSAWMSRLAERMALAPRITNATVRPIPRYRYTSCRWTPPRFIPAISAAIARTPVIMLRRKFGRRTGGRPFSVVARGSTASGDRSPIYRARSLIYLCLFARALIGRSLMPLPLRASAHRSLAVLLGASRLRCSLAHGLFYGIAVSGQRG